MATFIVGGIVILLFILASVKTFKDRKKGGCGGGCSGCNGCSQNNSCHTKQ